MLVSNVLSLTFLKLRMLINAMLSGSVLYSLIFLFLKNKRRLMRSPYCLYVYPP
jgi:hypothetical protein